jgi:hypothetical protein
LLPDSFFSRWQSSGQAVTPEDCLVLDEDTIARVRKECEPVLFRFENNTEVLASTKSNLVRHSLRAIVQKPFKDQAKKAIRILEPYLKSREADTQYTAAEALLKLVPTHEEANRVYWEHLRKCRGEQ